MKYYLVRCDRGHCGSGRSSEISFVFEADNILEAMNKAKKMPSIKHKRITPLAKEITKEEYLKLKAISAYKRTPSTHDAHPRII